MEEKEPKLGPSSTKFERSKPREEEEEEEVWEARFWSCVSTGVRKHLISLMAAVSHSRALCHLYHQVEVAVEILSAVFTLDVVPPVTDTELLVEDGSSRAHEGGLASPLLANMEHLHAH